MYFRDLTFSFFAKFGVNVYNMCTTICVQHNDRVNGCCTDFKMAAAAILNLFPVSIFVIQTFLRPSRCLVYVSAAQPVIVSRIGILYSALFIGQSKNQFTVAYKRSRLGRKINEVAIFSVQYTIVRPYSGWHLTEMNLSSLTTEYTS